MNSNALLALLCLPALLPAGEKRPERRLLDSDRVILLGGGFLEQERLHCYLETRLLRHHPRGELVFRNLGWGGDTVRGVARTGGYENPEGFARLLKEVTQWKPTVLFIGYGMNESFAGPAGLDAFIKDYNVLLDKLAPLKARTILLSPTYHEPLHHSDPAQHNEHLRRYTDAIREFAKKRGTDFIDLFEVMKMAKEADPSRALTTNGIQPNALGYALIARAIETYLDYDEPQVTLSADGKATGAGGVTLKSEITPGALRLTISDLAPALADPVGKETLLLTVKGLKEETALDMDGKRIARAAPAQWKRGIPLPLDTRTADKIRQAIIVKNDLFYRRWRPFNDHSRHFGFLKGDFSLYDKDIADQERTIRSMLTPRSMTLELISLDE